MRVKDYYKILNLPLTATQQDIKKAYRQLAMKYHPDKNAGNDLAKAHFLEVKEAYQVLSDPDRRSLYSQQHWYRQGKQKASNSELITPQTILYKSKKLSSYILSLDSSRIDQQALHGYMVSLLKEKSVSLLINWNDQITNEQIIAELLKAAKPLSFRYMEKISERLIRLAGSNNKTIEVIYGDLKHKKFVSFWYSYQFLIMLLLTLALCWCIYVISQ
ncbi:MAG: DnaJ domain-containing protein [Chitinophagaceae bacterium]